MWAAMKGHDNIAVRLAKMGGRKSLERKDAYGKTAMDYASADLKKRLSDAVSE